MEELNKKIEEYKKNQTWRYPFDEFWFEKGWTKAKKLQDEKVRKLKEIMWYLSNVKDTKMAHKFIDKIFGDDLNSEEKK